jgi:arabinofuranosyltransferase
MSESSDVQDPEGARGFLRWFFSEPSLEGEGRRARIALRVGLLLILAGYLFHAWTYWFLTDDSFIIFRYVRNFTAGEGLVFNPGLEAVEGYVCFLWLMLLAPFALLGIAPEHVANPLSVLFGAALLWLCYRFCARRPASGGWWILLLVAPLFLAATRSYAVWSTGGLGTRLFELLVVAALLQTIREMEAPAPSRWRQSSLLFALAALARPDANLIFLCVLVVRLVHEQVSGRLRWRGALHGVALFALVVGAHQVFRLLYYGDWLPNPYYAKAAGQSWWDMGGVYLFSFLLEYGAVLWIPLLVAALLGARRDASLHTPLIFAAAFLPHLLYVLSIGGDHFEYRALGLCFPLLFVLFYEGARYLARSRLRGALTTGYLGLCLGGVLALPTLTHLDFPEDYIVGFPGVGSREEGAPTLVDLERRTTLARTPLFGRYVELYNDTVERTTEHFVGIRQEEHVDFLRYVLWEGKLLADLVRRGLLPADLHVAIDCIGAIPYYSDLVVLDRLGLTDKQVAKSPPFNTHRMMAHDRYATPDYARLRGVEIWAADNVHLVMHEADPLMWRLVQDTRASGQPYQFTPLGDGHYLVGALLQGEAWSRARLGKLDFEWLGAFQLPGER